MRPERVYSLYVYMIGRCVVFVRWSRPLREICVGPALANRFTCFFFGQIKIFGDPSTNIELSQILCDSKRRKGAVAREQGEGKSWLFSFGGPSLPKVPKCQSTRDGILFAGLYRLTYNFVVDRCIDGTVLLQSCVRKNN